MEEDGYDYSYTYQFLPAIIGPCACAGPPCSYWYYPDNTCNPSKKLARRVERHRLVHLLQDVLKKKEK